MEDKTFAAGVYFDKASDKAPEWVVGKLSFKVADAVAFLQAHENNAGYVNCDIKEGKSGKCYVELDTWKPEKPDSLKDAQDTNEEMDERAAGLADDDEYGDANPDLIPF